MLNYEYRLNFHGQFEDIIILQHEIFPITNTSKNPDEQSTASTQSLTQTVEVIEKRPPKMKLLKIDKLDDVEQAILHDYSTTEQENTDRLIVDNVEQLCMDFAHTSMSDETLLRFGCSQCSSKTEQITQALEAITVLANNEKLDKIKSEKQQDELTDLKIFESLDIFNSVKNETEMIATITATPTATFGLQNDNVQKAEAKYFLNSISKKSSIIQFSEPSSTVDCVMSQQTTLESIKEEKEIVNSDESIGSRSIFDRSNDLFDQTSCSSISLQSFNTPQNSTYCVKRNDRRFSINQSPRSPSFQSPLHKMLKTESSSVISVEKEIKFNESIKNDIKHFDSNETRTTEFQIIDVCGYIYLFEKENLMPSSI